MALLRYLYCYENQLTSLPDLNALSELYYLRCNDNQLTALPDLTGLEKLRYIYLHNNQLTAQAIDAILVQLANTNTPSNGLLYYPGNPGASNDQRSTAANTAKTTLTDRGWTITA